MASLMKTDPTAWKYLRKEIIARDGGRCKKCGRSTNLEVHHIVAVMYDGTDEPDNLATLCYVCHREWEVFEAGMNTTFDEWLTLPPLIMLVALYKALGFEHNADVPAAKVRRDIATAHENMRSGWPDR